MLLLPRALNDLSAASQATTLFGTQYSSPFGISAIGYAGNYRRHADSLLAEAAAEANIPFLLSGGSNEPIETVARRAPGHVWYQLYGARDPQRTDHLVARAQDSGVAVLVFTVDFPVPPRIERILRSGIRPPASVHPRALPKLLWDLANHPRWSIEFLLGGGAPRLEGWAGYAREGAGAAEIARDYAQQIPSNQTWQDLERVRRRWSGKLIVKGLMHPEDARRAESLGADAVTVSNHGGVKLECLPATIDVLPSVASALAGRIPVLFDGGIRRGAHVLIAHCLGARFCFVGRAVLYGVIADGRSGARRAVEILRQEIAHTLMMVGCPAMGKLTSAHVTDSAR